MSFPRTYKQFINEWKKKLSNDKNIILTIKTDPLHENDVVVITRVDAVECRAFTKVYSLDKLKQHINTSYPKDEMDDYKVQAYIKFLCETTKSYPSLMYTLGRVVNGTPRFRDLRKGMVIKLEYNSPKMKYLGMSFPNKAYKFFVPSKNKEIYLDVRQFRNREVYSVDGFFGNTVPKEQKIDDMYMPVCKSVEDVMKELTE